MIQLQASARAERTDPGPVGKQAGFSAYSLLSLLTVKPRREAMHDPLLSGSPGTQDDAALAPKGSLPLAASTMGVWDPTAIHRGLPLRLHLSVT